VSPPNVSARTAPTIAVTSWFSAIGRVTARELADELEVSEKTARRDLEALLVPGVPLYSRPGRGGGWVLVGDGTTDLTGLTAGEAQALLLASSATAANAVVPVDTANALRKLVQALPEPLRADAEVAAQSLLVDTQQWNQEPVAAPSPHLATLQRAVVERRSVELDYVDRARTATTRVVEPLGLVSKGTVWYLVASTAAGRRTVRVARIAGAELTDERFARPADFDLAEAWDDVVRVVGERRIGVPATVLVDPSYVPGLRGQFGTDLIFADLDEPAPDGRVRVIIAGSSAYIVAQYLAGWGGLVEAVEPVELRAHLARIGRELTATYDHAWGQTPGVIESE
jgi:predicted DNA-binding transcriptional regulator YafY